MRVLLSDGSGLTSRQCVTALHAAGHEVEVLAPSRLALAALTRHTRAAHRVTPYGEAPLRWLEDALRVLARGGHDVLLPTQEQAFLLAKVAARVRALGIAVPVPAFAAIDAVQDKVSQVRTLARLGLPQPASEVVHAPGELRGARERLGGPVWVKRAIGTASGGVWRLAEGEAALAVEAALDDEDWTDGVVVQAPAGGRLLMVQAVYAHGELRAWHANARLREGANGGAAAKVSVSLPALEADLVTLGRDLGWHGALALDVIAGPDGHRVIDVNPRLVEPGNAAAAGTDLVGALLDVALDRPGRAAPPSRAGVRTRQTLIGVLGAAQRGEGRRGIARELGAALAGRGPYAGTREELTPTRRDPLAAVPVLAVGAATHARPASWGLFTSGAVAAYALTPAAWREIRGR